MIRMEMGRSNVAAESIVQRRGALDEVAAIALIFSDGIFVGPTKNWQSNRAGGLTMGGITRLQDK